MKVCDVVLNSIWYDPRVRKQIAEYLNKGIELSCVGLKCSRYDFDEVKKIPCKVKIVQISPDFDGRQKSIIKKLIREFLRYKGVKNAIVNERPDIIHANDLNALIPAYVAMRKLKCRLVYDSHEVNIENYTSNGRSPIAWLMKRVEKYIIKHIDLMVCVSNAASEYFSKTYNIKPPMVVTNCSLKKENICSLNIGKHLGFEILNHGQFYEGRGYDIMVKACPFISKYPEIKLAIRGFGKMEKELQEMSEVYDKRNQFLFYPPVNVEKLILTASESHVGVAITEPTCLNFKLSVSNKLFEYAAAGLPVIMSDIPEHRYLNKKFHFGIIILENTPQEFANAVLKLYQDKELYKILAENAKVMSQQLNWENEFHKLMNAEQTMLIRI